ESLLKGKFFVCVSNSIVLEYEEIVIKLNRKENANKLLSFLAFSPFVIYVSPTFYYHIISADPDDNKFVDCAITVNAEYIVTSDHHFDILKNTDFPNVEIIHPEDFIKHVLK
ncbi:MAG: putative toxin-antitoxin system toxin component, PIN family, partial [bacterium]